MTNKNNLLALKNKMKCKIKIKMKKLLIHKY